MRKTVWGMVEVRKHCAGTTGFQTSYGHDASAETKSTGGRRSGFSDVENWLHQTGVSQNNPPL